MVDPAETTLLTPQQVLQDATGPIMRGGRRFRIVILVLGVVFLAGVASFFLRLRGGFEDRASWGYYAAMFSYLLAIVATAPLVAVGLRLTKADWRRSLTRPAELFAVVGLLLILLFVPLLYLAPSAGEQQTIWLGWPHAPRLYDTLALATLVVCGLLLLYTSALPDLAALRDGGAMAKGWKRRWLNRLAGRWHGSARQWRLQRGALALFGIFYFMMLVMAQVLISADFAESFVPGWVDPLFPVQQVMAGVQTAVAMMVVVMAALRFLGFKEHFGIDHFWGMGKILLALSLLGFYFWFSGFIVMWYGRTLEEQNLLRLLWFGPYLPLFLTTFVLNYLGPLLILVWNPVRRSITGPLVVSAMIMAGALLERIRFYVAAYSVGETGPALEHVPPPVFPDAIDVFMLMGGLAGALLIYLATTRIVPVISIWEVREGLLLRARHNIGKLVTWVVAKPE